jgi:hypothetical protein
VADLELDGKPLASGDLLAVMQMQGATIDQTDTAAYGSITSLNGAGRYELVYVGGVSGNTITLDGALCGSLRFDYAAGAGSQVIRVPQYRNLTVRTGASVTAPAWDGQRGGVVILHVSDTTLLEANAVIDVSGKGFRGGRVEQSSAAPASAAGAPPPIVVYRSTDPAYGGEKGEGIAGFGGADPAITPSDQGKYTLGRYGRGAPANAGGGGNSHNAGGGGGSNGNSLAAWTGLGVLTTTDYGLYQAWQREFVNVNARPMSSGGGRGGYTYSANNENAGTRAPGATQWGGDYRRIVGGIGGRPLDNDPTGRLYFGGGGGAGDSNDGFGLAGGNGGGIVILVSKTVTGAGEILAHGASVGTTVPTHNDAPGGGGGGGTIVVSATTLSGIAARAEGGKGGTQGEVTVNAGNEAEGPGGGGGGGFVAISGAGITTSVTGGAYGTTLSPALSEFPPNGATRGAAGNTLTNVGTLPFCKAGGVSAVLSDGLSQVATGSTLSYTLTVRSDALQPLSGVSVVLAAPSGLAGTTWTCAPASLCGSASGSGDVGQTMALGAGDAVTFTLSGTVTATVGVTLTATAQITQGTNINVTAVDTTLVVDAACVSDSDCGEPASGIICVAGECVAGCRGTGNGCPDGLVCTSADALPGTCVTSGSGGAGGGGGTAGAGGSAGTAGEGGSGNAGGVSGTGGSAGSAGEGGSGNAGGASGTGGSAATAGDGGSGIAGGSSGTGGSAGTAGEGGSGNAGGSGVGGVSGSGGNEATGGDQGLAGSGGSEGSFSLEGGGCSCSTPARGTNLFSLASLFSLLGLALARRRQR